MVSGDVVKISSDSILIFGGVAIMEPNDGSTFIILIELVKSSDKVSKNWQLLSLNDFIAKGLSIAAVRLKDSVQIKELLKYHLSNVHLKSSINLRRSSVVPSKTSSAELIGASVTPTHEKHKNGRGTAVVLTLVIRSKY